MHSKSAVCTIYPTSNPCINERSRFRIEILYFFARFAHSRVKQWLIVYLKYDVGAGSYTDTLFALILVFNNKSLKNFNFNREPLDMN